MRSRRAEPVAIDRTIEVYLGATPLARPLSQADNYSGRRTDRHDSGNYSQCGDNDLYWVHPVVMLA
jgi:hypothetical protein